MKKRLKVVVMGGGTGTYPVVSALAKLDVDISAVITVADSGGSTGRIRDEFGFQPVGDLRQSLAALAENDGQEWIRKLLLYRFKKGNQFKGHNLGNLILTALQDMTGDTDKALAIVEKVFRLEGDVIPVTKQNVQLEIHYQDGQVVVGEHTLDKKVDHPTPIKTVKLVPKARINPRAAEAIQNADLIVIGPGDYYASIMSTLVASGTKKAFQESRAHILYIVNLMTRLTQTHNMTAQDHVQGIETAIGKPIDSILMNSQPVPKNILLHYQQEKEFPVQDDLNGDARLIRSRIIDDVKVEKSEVDTAHRSVLRHDSQKLRTVIKRIIDKL